MTCIRESNNKKTYLEALKMDTNERINGGRGGGEVNYTVSEDGLMAACC